MLEDLTHTNLVNGNGLYGKLRFVWNVVAAEFEGKLCFCALVCKDNEEVEVEAIGILLQFKLAPFEGFKSLMLKGNLDQTYEFGDKISQ